MHDAAATRAITYSSARARSFGMLQYSIWHYHRAHIVFTREIISSHASVHKEISMKGLAMVKCTFSESSAVQGTCMYCIHVRYSNRPLRGSAVCRM